MTFGSLFTGIGGIDLGLTRAGMECRWMVEIEPFCRKVLAKQFPGVPCYDDIREIGGDAECLNESMYSAEDSHAKMFPKPESEPDSPTLTARQLAAAFGLSSPVLLGYFDHDGLSLRTFQACLFPTETESGSTPLQFSEYLETFPDSGMWDAGSAFELQTSGRLTCESASSSWPTARQEDGESCGNHPGAVDNLTGAAKTWLTPHGMANEDKTGKKGGAGGGEFALQANNWQTPATDSFRSRGGDRKDEQGLDQQARMFPTPASRDYRTPNLKPGSERGMGSKGEQLQNFVEHTWPTPNSNPSGPNNSTTRENSRIAQRLTDQCLESRAQDFPSSPPAPQTPDGPQSSETAPTSRRRLNPRFVEWLMGFDPEWTEL